MQLPGSSTIWSSLYVFLLKMKSVAHFFFYLHIVCLTDIEICINHLQVLRSTLDMFYLAWQYLVYLHLLASYQSSMNSVLFILFKMLFRSPTHIVDTFSGSSRSWPSMGLNNYFANSFLKAFKCTYILL